MRNVQGFTRASSPWYILRVTCTNNMCTDNMVYVATNVYGLRLTSLVPRPRARDNTHDNTTVIDRSVGNTRHGHFQIEQDCKGGYKMSNKLEEHSYYNNDHNTVHKAYTSMNINENRFANFEDREKRSVVNVDMFKVLSQGKVNNLY